MKFYCGWQEEATVINRCYGYVEAESEEEAAELLKAGEVEVIDSAEWETLDSTVLTIDNICSDEEVVD